jgi:hypothetical protein
MTRVCANCGTEVDDEALFCPTCGQPIQAGAEPELPPAPEWPDSSSQVSEEPPDYQRTDGAAAGETAAPPGSAPTPPAPADEPDAPMPPDALAPAAPAPAPPAAATEPEPHADDPYAPETYIPPWRRGTPSASAGAASAHAETAGQAGYGDAGYADAGYADAAHGDAAHGDASSATPPAAAPISPAPPRPGSSAAGGLSPQGFLVTPTMLSGWLVGIGALVAVIAFFLPWYSFGNYTAVWGFASGVNLLVAIVLLAVLAVIFLAHLVPDIPRQDLAMAAIGLLGLGIGIDRLGLGGTGIGVLLFLIGTLAIAAGGFVSLLGVDRPLGETTR